MRKEKTGRTIFFLVILLFIAVMAVATYLLWPYVKKLAEPQVREAVRDWIKGLGIWGILLILGIQILQVMIAFLPGEPIEVLSGMLYGGFGGLVICLVGCALASMLTFSLTRRYGVPLIKRVFGEEKLSSLAFLQNTKRLETILFLLFLIPGTPKDILNYVAGLSMIKLSAFLAISMLARLPSLSGSTFAGANFMNGNWTTALIIFAVTAGIGLLGIRYKDQVITWIKRIGSRGTEE